MRWEGDSGRCSSAPRRVGRRARASIDGEVVEDDDERCGPPARGPARGPSCCASRPQQGLDGAGRRARPRRVCVARAAGLAWLRLSGRRGLVTELRARLGACVLLDARGLRREVDPWGTLSAEPLMRRVKARFDPTTPSTRGSEHMTPDTINVTSRRGGRTNALNAPDPSLIDDCVHCGFCLPTCPTYVPLGRGDGLPARAHPADARRPRGGRADVAAQVNAWDNCLGCMACVTACPSGVQYDKLIEDTRGQVERQWAAPAASAAPPGDLRALPPPRADEVDRALRAAGRASARFLGRFPRLKSLAQLARPKRVALPELTPRRGPSAAAWASCRAACSASSSATSTP